MIKQKVRLAALSLGLMCSPLWAEPFEPLYSFPASGENGIRPQTSLVLASDGNFYGVTSDGGAHGVGTLFKYSLSEGFSVVHDFDPATTGEMYITRPTGQLLNIGDGYLYGTTFNGGTPPSGAGTVYRFDPATGNITVLYAISSAGNTTPQSGVALVSGEANVLHALCYDYSGIWRIPLDGSPRTVQSFLAGTPKPTSIIRGSDGFLYGGTETGGPGQHGTLFRTNADGTGWTVLHECDTETGYIPTGAMVERDGYFYGVMGYGGPSNVRSVNGVVYRLSPAGDYEMLHAFNDFDVPSGDIIFASDGRLYGVARNFGPGGNGSGGVYRIRTDGSGYDVVYRFDSSENGVQYPTGREPVGGLTQGPDGYLYGTTYYGPKGSGGGIFRLKLNLPPPPINHPPIAVGDVGVLNGANVTVDVLANDFEADDAEKDSLIVAIEDVPDFGTAEVQGDGSILYTPNAGVFVGDSFTYKVTDLRGGSSVATVTIQTNAPGPLIQPGTYNGLVFRDENLSGEDELPRGQYVVKVNEDGRFTGTLFSQKKRASFRGTFDENGTAHTTLKIPDDGRGLIFLSFQRGAPNIVRAYVLGAHFWSGTAGPTTTSGFEDKRSYTVLIESDNAPSLAPGDLPKGFGYGTVIIKPTGVVTLIGKLGDGSNLKWSSSIVRRPESPNEIPFYAVPLKNGVFSGAVEASEGNRFEGAATWFRDVSKPNKPYALGFSGRAYVALAPFTPPTGDEPVMQIPGGVVGLYDLPNELPSTSGDFTIDGTKISKEGNLRALTINRKNGLFTGTMRVGNETVGFKTLGFKGAIDQSGGYGLGQVNVMGTTGAVELFHPVP
jgi:uncharacterized repeat protein (TIGR03803 family)